MNKAAALVHAASALTSNFTVVLTLVVCAAELLAFAAHPVTLVALQQLEHQLASNLLLPTVNKPTATSRIGFVPELLSVDLLHQHHPTRNLLIQNHLPLQDPLTALSQPQPLPLNATQQKTQKTLKVRQLQDLWTPKPTPLLRWLLVYLLV